MMVQGLGCSGCIAGDYDVVRVDIIIPPSPLPIQPKGLGFGGAVAVDVYEMSMML